ncbi:hypothetical protein HYC85_014013 [Camellia sinensis]|uniref:Uncharacterized protein n=1 Tax=Camellia sinensis TaxID=4442 RepID=A0A7J7H8D0_CAMSI|nr:hypothetical protein HYC85_014013 [Camellia sinensis]
MQGVNLFGQIGYGYEEFFSESGKPTTAQHLLWARITRNWLQLAASMLLVEIKFLKSASSKLCTAQGMELEQCVNSSMCLPQKPKLVIGLRGSSANIFADNATHRDFLFNTC